MIQAAIFDMDGLLIDSEPMWKHAEKHVFTSVGVNVSDELAIQTATMTTREVTQFWYRHFPWSGKSLKQVEDEVVAHVESLIVEHGVQLDGVSKVLDFFKQQNIKIGLATNSPASLIPIILNKLGIAHYFDAISSAEDEHKGKPDPAVYLSTINKLNVNPSQCIAFEDSVSGLIAAKKANLKTVAVPSHTEFFLTKFDISHLKIHRLSDFSKQHLTQLMAC